jgi:argininosuccinate synthase
MKKVVLAFSGGLDTSYCALYLSKDLGYEVHTITVNTGGFSADELKEIEKRALSLGVASHKTVDETKTYYEKVIRYLVFGNVLKNGTYPLSVSAGNDQVRFDMIIQILAPGTEIITPIRDMKLSREAEIEYLKSKGVVFNFEKAKYSINKGIWGTSIGGRETLNSLGQLPEEAWPTQVTKHGSEEVRMGFEKGELKTVNGKSFAHSVDAIHFLQILAGPYGIGRDIHVGDTIIGIKGRVGFEAAAPVLIIKAHHALEKHVLTKWQLSWKDQLAQFYGNWLHEGQYLDPIMRDMEAFLTSSQQNVTGEVSITLHPYRYQINGIESKYDLMSAKFGKYGEMNLGWTADDVKGFTKIFGNQVAIYHQVKEEAEKA